MLRRLLIGFGMVGLGVVFLAGTVSAEAYPNRRAGHTVVSANLGVGSGQAKDVDFSTQRYAAFAIQAQFGYCVNDWLLLSGEGTLWTRYINSSNVYLGDLLVAGTYFVASSGLFVKGGIGLGIADAQFWVGATPVSNTQTGLAYMGAIGYEYRVSPTMGVGPQFDYNYFDLNDKTSVNYWNITLAFNWYM